MPISKPVREQVFNDIIIKYLLPSASSSIDKAVLDEFKSATGKKYSDLLNKLLVNTKELLDEIGKNLGQGRCADIAAVAHRLKSGSGQIGALKLQHLAIGIEKMALKGDEANIKPILKEAQEEFAKVMVTFS